MVREASLSVAGGFELVFLTGGGAGVERIVFLHSNAAGAEQFRREVDAYADVFPTVAVSLRGHGGSGLPADPTVEDFGVAMLASDVTAVLDRLGVERAHMVVSSVGGLVAFELLASQPGRVASLVTFGSLAVVSAPWLAGVLFAAGLRALGRRGMAALFALPAASGAARERVRALVRRADPRAVGLVARNVAGAGYDYTDVLRRSTVPWLLVQAGRDRYVNRHLASTLQAGRASPRFAVAYLPGARHMANLDDPAGFDRVVRPFLAATCR